jgi:MFS family permease
MNDVIRFQWILFVVNGFGWVVDNFWSQGLTAVRPTAANEFTSAVSPSFSSVAYYVGLILGASFWSASADIVGRKFAFNATILIGGIFACAVAGAQVSHPQSYIILLAKFLYILAKCSDDACRLVSSIALTTHDRTGLHNILFSLGSHRHSGWR